MTILGSTDDGADLTVDVERLTGSHACIIANAGGGKSGTIRKLLEVTHGDIQHIVLDIEDEYYTLRQAGDYVIAGGDDADCPAGIGNARELATAALTHGFSMIVQMNDMGGEDAREFVHRFLDQMITSPRELWRPVLVVIDEVQRFEPRDIQMLTERGRKRGYTAILASQRLPKIDANIRGDINNWIMGRVGQTLDRNIMNDQLGFTRREGTEKLRGIRPRHFYAFGPAFVEEPTLFRTGPVETAMPKPGQAKVSTPPAAKDMKGLLPTLSVENEGPGDATPIVGTEGDPAAMLILRQENTRLSTELDMAVKKNKLAGTLLDESRHIMGKILAGTTGLSTALDEIADIMQSAGDRKVGRIVHADNVFDMSEERAKKITTEGVDADDDVEITGPQRQFLRALNWWAEKGIDAPTRAQAAFIAGWSPRSSHVSNVASSLRTRGLIDYPESGRFTLTTEGELVAPEPDRSQTLIQSVQAALDGPQNKILECLLEDHASGQRREDVAERCGWSASSSHVSNVISSLKTLSVIEYPNKGIIKLAGWVR